MKSERVKPFFIVVYGYLYESMLLHRLAAA